MSAGTKLGRIGIASVRVSGTYGMAECTAVPVRYYFDAQSIQQFILLWYDKSANVVRVLSHGRLSYTCSWYFVSHSYSDATALRAWTIIINTLVYFFPCPLLRNGTNPNKPTKSPGYGHFPTIMAHIKVPRPVMLFRVLRGTRPDPRDFGSLLDRPDHTRKVLKTVDPIRPDPTRETSKSPDPSRADPRDFKTS